MLVLANTVILLMMYQKEHGYVMFQIIMIFNWVDYTPVSYGAYTYPGWAEGLGWALAALSLICIPMGMIKSVVEAEGSNICQVRF